MTEKSKTIWDFISMNEIKQSLRIDHNEDDVLLKTLFEAALEKLEKFIGKTIIQNDYEVIVSNHDSAMIELPHRPVLEVKSVFDSAIQKIPYTLIENTIVIGFIPLNTTLKIIYTAGMVIDTLPPLLKVALFDITSCFYEKGCETNFLPSILDKFNIFQDYKL